jgi:malate synthase
VFDQLMPEANQIARKRGDVAVTAQDLLTVPEGTVTERGLRHNLNVGVLYMEAWLRGSGCVPIYHLMEDAATAEISRAQVWQWRRHGAQIEGGPAIDGALVERLLEEELERIKDTVGRERYGAGGYGEAAGLLRELVLADEFTEFLTLPAYERVVTPA